MIGCVAEDFCIASTASVLCPICRGLLRKGLGTRVTARGDRAILCHPAQLVSPATVGAKWLTGPCLHRSCRRLRSNWHKPTVTTPVACCLWGHKEMECVRESLSLASRVTTGVYASNWHHRPNFTMSDTAKSVHWCASAAAILHSTKTQGTSPT